MFKSKKQKELINRLIAENNKLKEESRIHNKIMGEQQPETDLLVEQRELAKLKRVLDKTIAKYKKLIVEVKELKKQSKQELEEAKGLKEKYKEELEKLIVTIKQN